MYKQRNKLFTKYFTISLILGVIINCALYIHYNSFTNDFSYYAQLFGLIVLGVFQYGMHVNKAKLAGIGGFIADFIQLVIFVQLHIWGLAITYTFGVCAEIYLAIKGKDGFQEHTSWKTHLWKLGLILFISLILYWVFRDKNLNYWSMFFDLVSTVLIPVAYYLQAKQSPRQFLFWVTSDISGIFPPIFSGNVYTILAFAYYIIFDSLNWIKWTMFSDDNEQKKA